MSPEICCHLNYLPVVSHWSVVSVSVQFTEAGGVKKKSVSRKKQKPNKHDDAILFILAQCLSVTMTFLDETKSWVALYKVTSDPDLTVY